MKKKSPDFMGKAILLSLILIILNLIGGFAHLQFETWFKWLPSIILLVAIIIFCIQYGKLETDGVTYGKAFGMSSNTSRSSGSLDGSAGWSYFALSEPSCSQRCLDSV